MPCWIEHLCPCLKVHIFWEGHKFLQNLQRRFVLCIVVTFLWCIFCKILWLSQIMYELYFALLSKLSSKKSISESKLLYFCFSVYLFVCKYMTLSTLFAWWLDQSSSVNKRNTEGDRNFRFLFKSFKMNCVIFWSGNQQQASRLWQDNHIWWPIISLSCFKSLGLRAPAKLTYGKTQQF